MRSKIKLDVSTLADLARELVAERKRQGLSREQAAAVCNVSESFIRDAESDPGRCSLLKLLELTAGLGLTMTLAGLQADTAAADLPHAAGVRP
ncbi:MAG: helix-turn-helix domain-containing protein [Polaromonas sp.]|nr:helix-turn-helix domain-containing protein [Polaromonas sp.]